MPLSMYQASAPIFLRQFAALTVLLDKAEAHAGAQGVAEADFMTARLAPDMLPLTKQIQIASDGAKAGIGRLAGIEIPAFEDTEASFADLRTRIARTVAFIKGVPAAQVDGTEDKTITFTIRGREYSFVGQPFLLHFVLPNFFFHVSVAYAILRHQGVKIGKQDYLGGL